MDTANNTDNNQTPVGINGQPLPPISQKDKEAMMALAEKIQYRPQPHVYMALTYLEEHGYSDEQVQEITATLTELVISQLFVHLAKKIPHSKITSMLDIAKSLNSLQVMKLFDTVYRKETGQELDSEVAKITKDVWRAYLRDLKTSESEGDMKANAPVPTAGGGGE